MDVLVEDGSGVDVCFPGAHGEEDGQRGGVEVSSMLGQADDHGCVRPVGEKGVGEDVPADVLGKTRPGKGVGLGLAGLRGGVMFYQRREASCG